jgi:AraC-like DNA-binding protein
MRTRPLIPPTAAPVELLILSGQAAVPPAAHYTVTLAESAAGALELFFSAPGQTGPAPRRSRGQQLRFTEEFIEPTGAERELLWQLFHPAEPAPVQVPAEPAAEIRRLLAGLHRQQAGAAPLRDALRKAYLKTLLLHFTQLSQQQFGEAVRAASSGLVTRFQRLLEQHYTRWKSVHEYAAHLRVTANHLSVTTRRQTGHTAGEHIRRRLMLEARGLAAAGDTTLKEVAYQLGFDDPAHFSKLFKRCTGTTFSDFRQQRLAADERPTRATAA